MQKRFWVMNEENEIENAHENLNNYVYYLGKFYFIFFDKLMKGDQ